MPMYDRQKAVQYGQRYAQSPNSAYYTFPQDCTNFVSQSLFAGGWTMIQGQKQSSSVWYCDKKEWYSFAISPASYTWAGARNFHDFLSGSGRAKLAKKPEDLTLGDVVQMSNSGGIHHTMLVTGLVTGSYNDLTMSYHTPNTPHRLLSDISAKSNGETFIYWKLLDAFTK